MESTHSENLAFYQLVGRIFYAAAKVDNVVKAEEIKKVKELVNQHWVLPADQQGQFKTNGVHPIQVVVDNLHEKDEKLDQIINELNTFKAAHSSLFTKQINSLILETTWQIISAFAKRNKSELVFFSQLEHALK